MRVFDGGGASSRALYVEFQRTLRIPDDGKVYPLPAGFGNFPLRHVDDYREAVPAPWTERGGVLMPMYQSEALWIRFGTDYPFAVKVAAGKINAVTGDARTAGLQAHPQNYLVVPEQPWLDGFAVQKGTDNRKSGCWRYSTPSFPDEPGGILSNEVSKTSSKISRGSGG